MSTPFKVRGPLARGYSPCVQHMLTLSWAVGWKLKSDLTFLDSRVTSRIAGRYFYLRLKYTYIHLLSTNERNSVDRNVHVLEHC